MYINPFLLIIFARNHCIRHIINGKNEFCSSSTFSFINVRKDFNEK